MKNIAMALAAILGIIPGLSSAAEIYNKDGNKLDFYGRVAAKYLFKNRVMKMQLMCVLVSRVKQNK